MDDVTRDLLQGLLDLNNANASKIAGLTAMNTLYFHIIADLLWRTDILQNQPVEAREALLAAMKSAERMIDLTDNRGSFYPLVELINNQIV